MLYTFLFWLSAELIYSYTYSNFIFPLLYASERVGFFFIAVVLLK